MPKAKKPDAPDVGLSVRLPTDLHAAATALAEADDRTLNSFVVKAIREKVEREKKGGAR